MQKGLLTHWLAAIGGGLTVLVGIATFSAHDRIKPAQALSAEAQPSAQPDPALDELRQRLNQLERQNAASAPVPLPAQPIQAEAQGQLPNAPHEPEQEARSFEQASVEQAEQVLATETVDTNWSRSTEVNIQKVFDQQDLHDTRLMTARCRSTLCRIEVEHANENAKQAFILNGMAKPPFVGNAVFAHAEPDKQGHFVLYLAREGHNLPQPDTQRTQ